MAEQWSLTTLARLEAWRAPMNAGYERARRLFLEHLEPAERRTFLVGSFIDVGAYRLTFFGRPLGVTSEGNGQRYCIVPNDHRIYHGQAESNDDILGGCACHECRRKVERDLEVYLDDDWAQAPDVWLTVLLWLRYNEDEFLQTAIATEVL